MEAGGGKGHVDWLSDLLYSLEETCAFNVVLPKSGRYRRRRTSKIFGFRIGLIHGSPTSEMTCTRVGSMSPLCKDVPSRHEASAWLLLCILGVESERSLRHRCEWKIMCQIEEYSTDYNFDDQRG